MARNVLSDILRIKELRERIFFTLGIILLYRIGTHIAIPGIDVGALMAQNVNNKDNAVNIFLDFFSGGAFTNFSIFMLGVMPYISMSIIMSLALVIFPRLKKAVEEEGGKKRHQRWIRNGTLIVCIFQAWLSANMANAEVLRIDPIMFKIVAVITTTTGTLFLMWIGEQINNRGIGNGISLIIFAGIVARLPQAVYQVGDQIASGAQNQIFVLILILIFIFVIVLVIFEQRGQRKIPVNYAKRVVGRKQYGSANTYIPFKINPSGVIPVIFASSILQIPLQLLSSMSQAPEWLNGVSAFLTPTGVPYLILYTLLIIFFAFFYTQVTLNPIEISRQIRDNGGSIPGIRSEKTQEYLQRVLNRIVLPGALFLSFIALIPAIVMAVFNLPPSISYLLGGTSLLIIVGVALDLMSQVDGQLRMHHHEGLSNKARIRGRNL